jgi:elongator complex protein 1
VDSGVGWGTDDQVVHQMMFSPDSEVLAVVLAPRGWQYHHNQQLRQESPVSPEVSPGAGEGLAADLSPDESGPWQVQLWHRSNWHWYLKQVMVWEAPGPGGVHGVWEEGGGQLLLHLMGSWGEYCRVVWGWEYSVSARGTAAVVDGCQVLLTPLR